MRLNYITRKEIACKCGCGKDTFDVELSEVLESTRAHFNKRMFILSGNRCKKHNKKVGGVYDSQHLYSKAGDFQIEGVSPLSIYNYLDGKYPNQFGLGLYPSFVHVDVRPTMARW